MFQFRVEASSRPYAETTLKSRFIGSCTSVFRKSAVAAIGVALLPESTLLHWGSLGLTSRSPLFYLNMLRLWQTPLEGLKILDLGSGRSRFAQSINLIYGNTGAEVHAIDSFWRAPGPNGQVGLAEFLPFPDKQFDLVISNIALAMWDRVTFVGALDEALRVLKPSGELRFSLSFMMHLGGERYFKEVLQKHPEVASVKYISMGLALEPAFLVTKIADSVVRSSHDYIDYYSWQEKHFSLGGWRPQLLEDLEKEVDESSPNDLSLHAVRKVSRGLNLPSRLIDGLLSFVDPTDQKLSEESRRIFELFILYRRRSGSYPEAFLEKWESTNSGVKNDFFTRHLQHIGRDTYLNGATYLEQLAVSLDETGKIKWQAFKERSREALFQHYEQSRKR